MAKIIGAKYIISYPIKKSPLNFFINKKIPYSKEENINTYKANYNIKYLQNICKYEELEAKYIRNDINYNSIKEKFHLPDLYIVLSPTSKAQIKDWDYDNIKNFIINNPFKTVLVGTKLAADIAKKLNYENINYIDLTNKTNITELGAIIKKSKVCVSVDTGTFHFAYTQNVNTIGLFFNDLKIKEWVPQNNNCIKILKGIKYLENNKIICKQNISANDVINEIKKFDLVQSKNKNTVNEQSV